MTRNEWIERAEAEEEALRMVLENLILFCWHCFEEDGIAPTNEQIDAVVSEAVQSYKDVIEDI